MRYGLAALGLLGCLLLAACPRTAPPGTSGRAAGTPPSAEDETATPVAPPSSGEGVLGATDVIEVRVFREVDLSGEYEVEADGSINFPLVGSVAVAGLSPTEASTAIEAKLEEGFLRDASVTIRVLEYNSRQIHVFGEVQQPGSYPYADGMSIIQAIALAGGLTENHAANRTTVTRTEGGDQVVVQVPFGDISQGRAVNVPLHPEDVVVVPRSPI